MTKERKMLKRFKKMQNWKQKEKIRVKKEKKKERI